LRMDIMVILSRGRATAAATSDRSASDRNLKLFRYD
jgi:hypothetical protein